MSAPRKVTLVHGIPLSYYYYYYMIYIYMEHIIIYVCIMKMEKNRAIKHLCAEQAPDNNSVFISSTTPLL